ncbi:hypothetical protein [Novosphingobium soli]|uniref:Secreted protein n=1 Tax=Novosphingobium soli TaxID=574956 RepID=A0ABV6CYC8_9SPHN
MTIVPPALFLLAALAALITIWRSASTALPAIRSLRRQLAAEDQHIIEVRCIETRACSTEVGAQHRSRIRRPAAPQPITHRLYQFPHRSHAA